MPRGVLMEAITKHGMRPNFPAGAPPPYVALAQQCWSVSPSARPTFAEVLTSLLGMMQSLCGEAVEGASGGARGGLMHVGSSQLGVAASAPASAGSQQPRSARGGGTMGAPLYTMPRFGPVSSSAALVGGGVVGAPGPLSGTAAALGGNYTTSTLTLAKLSMYARTSAPPTQPGYERGNTAANTSTAATHESMSGVMRSRLSSNTHNTEISTEPTTTTLAGVAGSAAGARPPIPGGAALVSPGRRGPGSSASGMSSLPAAAAFSISDAAGMGSVFARRVARVDLAAPQVARALAAYPAAYPLDQLPPGATMAGPRSASGAAAARRDSQLSQPPYTASLPPLHQHSHLTSTSQDDPRRAMSSALTAYDSSSHTGVHMKTGSEEPCEMCEGGAVSGGRSLLHRHSNSANTAPGGTVGGMTFAGRLEPEAALTAPQVCCEGFLES